MKKLGSACMILALTLLSGCTEKGHASDPSHNLVEEQQGVKLSVTLDKSSYSASENIQVHVEATNEGQSDVPYIGYSSCDPGLQVKSAGYTRVRKSGEPEVCAAVIVDKVLKPQQTIALDVTLQPTSAVTVGQHTVQAVFQRGNQEQPMRTEIPFEVR